MDNNKSQFPFFLYVFGLNGKHNGKQPIVNTDELFEIFRQLKAVIANKQEIIITDSEDFCVFHAKDGVVKFPPKENMEKHNRS